MRVGFDLDGVLYDFADAMRRWINTHEHDYNLGEGHPSMYNWWPEWGMTPEQWARFVHDGVDAQVIFCGPALDDAANQVRRVKEAGHSVHIITARFFGTDPEQSQRNTKLWLSEHDIPFDTLDFSKDKTTEPTDFFLEDVIKNYDAVEAAGTLAYLVNRPWNMQQDHRHRVNSVKEYVDIILSGQLE
jgi:hypothetical protein